jgi:hypothetical protein
MKNRLFRTLNFCALNVLFFAIYLNFIHKDQNQTATVEQNQSALMQEGAVLVSNPEKVLDKGSFNLMSKPEQFSVQHQ